MDRTARTALLPRLGQLRAADIREKAPAELVTIADRDGERLLAEGLSAILPQAQIVGEETASDDPALLARLPAGLCWLVDPLDGTANFAAGHGPFGIMVALVDRGMPVAGWILDPLAGQRCYAAIGTGAFIDDTPVRCTLPHATAGRIGVSSLLADAAALPPGLAGLSALGHVLQLPRCAAAIYPQLAAGQLHAALFARTLPWDHAAGAVLLTEAGGTATRFDGTPWNAGDGGQGLIATADAGLHQRIAAIVSSAGAAR